MKIPKQCPVCGSATGWKQINAWHEGFSFTKALMGRWLLGNFGALAGVGGKKKRLFRCGSCGHIMQYER